MLDYCETWLATVNLVTCHQKRSSTRTGWKVVRRTVEDSPVCPPAVVLLFLDSVSSSSFFSSLLSPPCLWRQRSYSPSAVWNSSGSIHSKQLKHLPSIYLTTNCHSVYLLPLLTCLAIMATADTAMHLFLSELDFPGCEASTQLLLRWPLKD